MKKIFCYLLLLTGVCMHSQNVSYLPECKNAEFQKKCTRDKLETEIRGLITEDMFESMKTAGKQHFVVQTIFIVDGNGKVIPTETRFLSDIEALKELVIKYINDLPSFIPKDKSEEEPRDIHFVTLDFILDENEQGYHIAEKGELHKKHIKPNYIKYDEYPVYPGCEGLYDSEQKCMTTNMYKKIIDKFRIPRNAPYGQVKMLVEFIITKNGEIGIGKIAGGSEDFHKEIKRVFGKLPKLSPAKISGIPLDIYFNLPVTVNVN
ncbi:hypothetical protein GR160_11695 [Flavobacterium sp. Sd200]|uniref:hypothetical protein n=1 Tax=Flavobacterium sp. Sd200 TaxID=2692211 RepID=UPI00136C13B8|nr:hypothetical protein [Flavobacterium sp. Sd200]MXN91886.1 hypothetical protein [Flavobacterium sp. Sd200]